MRFDFPQVELHLHLDGSFRPETVWELAEAKGVAMPAQDLAGYRDYLAATADCASVNEYLERFELPLRVMQDAAALTRITRELIWDLADRGTAYAEIRFAPQLHTRQGLTQRQAVEAVLEVKSCSVSMLQRRVKLGYSRAARIVDQMEELGIVGPYEGAKPRQVLIDRAGWHDIQVQLGLASDDDLSLAAEMNDENDY